MPYGETGYGEKYVTATNYKYGRLISVTEETIQFDQTGQILMRAKKIGEKAALKQEQLIIEGIIDKNSTVYKPNNTATALYSTTRTYPNATATAFGEAGLEDIEILIGNMKDDNGDPIFVNDATMNLLVPKEVKVEAWQLMNSTNTPESAENAKNYFNGKYKPLTSPFLTDSADYWLGDFAQDFWWLEVYPLQLMTRNMKDTDEGFKRDIIAQYKTRFFGAIMAVDYRHSYQGSK